MSNFQKQIMESRHLIRDELEYLDVRGLNYSFEFERIDTRYWGQFMINTWWAPFVASAVYVALIFGLEKYMENRKPFDLRTPLIWWNAALGLFSIAGLVRFGATLPHYFYSLGAMFDGVCTEEKLDVRVAYWGLLFAISKYVELGDTLFIVLRKRPLQVLQWYHHIATLILVWLTLPYAEPVGKWFVGMNYAVHGAMYPYFALKMAGVHVPKFISNLITTAQLTQMIIGFLLNIGTIAALGLGVRCHRTNIGIYLFFIVYGTFVILFGKLFYKSVLNPSSQKPKNL